MQHSNTDSCILLKFYIKPQPVANARIVSVVVSYWNSTSNHNTIGTETPVARVVSYWNSTSNHNSVRSPAVPCPVVSYWNSTSNHNPPSGGYTYHGCILLKFYIKPQQRSSPMEISAVVSYWNSTSNHNMRHAVGMPLRLYLIEILHQTTTRVQLVRFPLVLYLIEILHQTTTARPAGLRFSCCILLKFYIKPQLRLERELACCSCILLKFYIKPQQVWFSSKFFLVVSYWNSTSNHNSGGAPVSPGAVVSYWNSTSNHNTRPCPAALRVVVSYWNSTSNHNSISPRAIHGIVVSYWNSTSNHNHWRWDRSFRWVVSYWNSTSNHNIVGDHTTAPSLYLIEILHQTTTRSKLLWLFAGCILLKFYIKPQQ